MIDAMIDRLTPFLLKVKRTRAHTLPVPTRAHETDAGLDLPLDLEAMLDAVKLGKHSGGNGDHGYEFEANDADLVSELVLNPGGFVWVPTGWCVEIQPGFEGQLRGRSGNAFNHGVTIGHVGTVDAGFRGEVKVALVNHGQFLRKFRHGDRIAQLVINEIPLRIVVEESLQLGDAPRGAKGYGSTGR